MVSPLCGPCSGLCLQENIKGKVSANKRYQRRGGPWSQFIYIKIGREMFQKKGRRKKRKSGVSLVSTLFTPLSKIFTGLHMKPPSENMFTSTMYSSQTAPWLGVVLVPTVHYLYTIHVKAIWWKTFVCFTAIFFFFFLFFSLTPHPQANHLSNLLCMAHMKQHRTRTTTKKQNSCLPCSFSTSIFASICQHWLQTEMLLLARRLKGTAFIEFIQFGLDCQNTNTPAKTPRLH